jgi:hypothetical protein
MAIMLRASLLSLVVALAAAAPVHAAVCDGAAGYSAAFGGRHTFLWRADALQQVKARKDSSPAYTALLKDADKAMTAGPWSVTDKTRTPPSGDKHDYMSIGPYWWPDPAKPDGLPYINRDGQVNPERATGAFDRTRFGNMASAVQSLSLAYYYSGDDKYAKRAALILRAWFLDPATRMNPNLNFAQGVPGSTAGRSFGIIDSAELLGVTESIGLLEPSGALSGDDLKGLHTWFGDLSDWMVTSANGKEERAAKNNHAIWYDLELSEFALFSGKADLAKSVISGFGEARLNAQMAPDGSLPQELARTRSFHYSTWAMQAVYDVATLGECVGVDLWSYQGPDGRSLRKATDFIAAYSGRETDWKWQEISMDKEDLYDALVRASQGFRDPALSAKANIHAADFAPARINLTVPAYQK